jgi:polynucleotide 5'-hydroxyl-kinase GRC3/NOL9
MAQHNSEGNPGLPAEKPLLLLHSPHSRSQTLKKGNVYFVVGTAQLNLIEGRISVAAKNLAAGDRFVIPRGKALPVEAVSDAVLNVKLGDNGSMILLPGRTVPDDWDRLVAKIIAEKKRVVLLLGETDTGKTFFTTYLANRLTGMGTKTAVLDCDTGQSNIGPPGTIGLAVLEHPVLFSAVKPLALYFTGAYSPGANFLEYGIGIARMMKKAQILSDSVIINTPGWVQGDGGRLLARAQAELFSPDIIVLLQREHELEYLARSLPGKTVTLTVPAIIPVRSQDERKQLREQASKDYFRNGREILVPFRQVTGDRSYLLSGFPLKSSEINRTLRSHVVLRAERLGSREGVLVATRRPLAAGETAAVRAAVGAGRIKNVVAGDENGLVVALNDKDNNVLALGIIQKIEYGKGTFRIYTPLPVRLKGKIKIVQFGSVKLTPDGEEAGTMEPGYL